MSAEENSGSSGYWRKAIPAWQQVPAPAPTEPEAVAEAVAPAHATEWVGDVEKGTGRASLTAAEQTALGMGYGAHMNTGYAKRDPSYQQAQHIAAGGTSIGAAPATTSSIVTDRTNTKGATS
jgi:hypothetical protein